MNEAVWRIGEPPVFLHTSPPTSFIEPILSQLDPRQHAVAFMIENSAVFDSEWHLVYANLQWEKNTGLSRDATRGKTLWEYAPTLVGSDLGQTYIRCMETKEMCTFTSLHPLTNKYVITWVYPGDTSFCVQLRDFKLLDDTRVKNTLEMQRWNEELESRVEQRTHDLKKAQEFNARVIKDSMDGIVGLDTNLEVFAWNPTMERLTGISKDSVIGKSILLLFPPHKQQDIQSILKRVLKGETIIFRGESFLAPETESSKNREFESLGGADYERYYMPIAGDVDGTVVGAVVIYKNITTQNQITLALTKARDEALSLAKIKSEFLANMSHELRTPLNAIIGLTDLLRDSIMDPQQREYFEIIQGSAVSLLNIVNHVLDFSKYEVGKMPLVEEAFSLAAVVHASTAVFEREAKRKPIEFACFFLDDLDYYTVHGDPVRLRQVLVNLVGNAIKFTSRGFVHVVLSQVADPGGARKEKEKEHERDKEKGKKKEKQKIRPGGINDEESANDKENIYGEYEGDGDVGKEEEDNVVWVGITVEDSGVGMSESTLKALFTPFTQADASTTRVYGGTGLGLAIVKQIVEYVGGGVSVTSKEDVGTSFHVRIPFKIVSIDKPRVDKEMRRMRERRNTIIGYDTTKLTPLSLLSDVSMSEEDEDKDEEEAVGEIERERQRERQREREKEREEREERESVVYENREKAKYDTVGNQELETETGQSSQHQNRQHTTSISNQFTPLFSQTWAGRKRSKSGTFERYFGTGSSSLMDSPPPPPPPVVPSVTRRRSLERANSSGTSERTHALVVEDNEVNKKVLSLLLKRLKWTVDVCSNGVEAVATLSENPEKFDIVLMDVQMPLMDGYTAAEEIRKDPRLAHVPIIAMTANAMPGDKERCLDSGMDDYISKPVNMKILAPILDTWGKKQNTNNNSSDSPGPSNSPTSPLSTSQA